MTKNAFSPTLRKLHFSIHFLLVTLKVSRNFLHKNSMNYLNDSLIVVSLSYFLEFVVSLSVLVGFIHTFPIHITLEFQIKTTVGATNYVAEN